jgi:hypothetical protein
VSAAGAAIGIDAAGHSGSSTLARVVLAASLVAWLVLLGLVLAHPVFVTNDSLNNYAHVWYISERLQGGHSLPFSMPVLGHGDAYAYPYGFVPWTAAAVLRLLIGDWAVTLTLVAGLLLVVAGTFWALPELRRPSLAMFVLLNPFLVESLILGQLPFLWAAALLFAAIAFWRKGSPVLAALACAAAQATHPAVLMPIAGFVVAARLPSEPERRKLIVAYAASVLLALPAAYIVLASPVVSDTGTVTVLTNFFGTVALRSMVVLLPLGVALWRSRLPERPAPYLALAMALLLLPMLPLRRDQFAWEALLREPDHAVREFTSSPAFAAGATYRVLRAHDGKVSMYDVLLAGGRLDSEFFPESIHRRNWPDTAAYSGFLEARNVDFVIIFDSYSQTFQTNEIDLLRELSGSGARGAKAELAFHGSGFDVFRVGLAGSSN